MQPPLRAIHGTIPLKLQQLRKASTEQLLASLLPGQPESLKTRDDGCVLDGHHRLEVLRERGIDVDALPREIVPYHPLGGS
jgi:hypothetical protein